MLVLCLSAAKSGKATPGPRPTPKPSESANLSDKQSSQYPSPTPNSNLADTPDRTKTADTKQNQSSDTPTTIIVVFTVITGVATGLIALFNWQLVGVTDEMKSATRQAADAARAGLHLYRPYLLVTAIDLEEGEFSKDYPKIMVQNLGTGPADIIDIRVASGLFDMRTNLGNPEAFELVVEPEGQPKESRTVIVGGTSIPTELCSVLVSAEDEAVATMPYNSRGKTTIRKTLAVWGSIRYRGGPPDEVYETKFFWWYLPVESVVEYKGFFLRGPNRLNRRT